MKLDEHADLLDLELRPGQRQVIEAVVAGRDAVVVMPTGSGKSAIYQIAGSAVPGVTVVVSPLLALQADQLSSIAESDLPEAARIDGDTAEAERTEILERAAADSLEYLFLTPESLLGLIDDDALDRIDVSLLVIDEAHCIVTWGHGFRPAFLSLGEARRRLGRPTTIALTASADPRMRSDIAATLGLDEHLEAVLEVVRDNIHIDLTVADRHDAAADEAARLALATPGKVLIYVPRVALAEQLGEAIRREGRPAAAYHGRLDADARSAAVALIEQESDAIVAATTAFGMGIDIADVRAVVHLDLPATLIDYYQEIGRAGRDGEPARAVAVVTPTKASRRSFTSGVRTTDAGVCARVHETLQSGITTRRSIAEAIDETIGTVSRALHVLAETGAITLTPEVRVVADLDVEAVAATIRRREEFHRSQRQAVDAYVGADDCRWQRIAAALGEVAEPCGHCDNCDRSGSGNSDDRADERIGATVTHREFGSGRIAGIDGDEATILFDEGGPKRISLPHVDDGTLVFERT